MENIYILAGDGFKESMDLTAYTKSAEDLFPLIEKETRECTYKVRNMRVVSEGKYDGVIAYEYEYEFEEWDDSPYKKEIIFFKIPLFKNE